MSDEILPQGQEIVTTQHFWHENTTGCYETTNKKSTAYIEESDDLIGKYCQACFFGAKSEQFIKMCKELKNNIEADLKNNIIAVWYDESHLNKYILNNECKRLHTGYCHPSDYPLESNKNKVKILHKNANGTPDHTNLTRRVFL